MPCDIATDYQKLLSAIKAHIPIAQQRTREPLCQQQVPLHAPDLHALAVLSARKSHPWHPKGQSPSPREGPGVAFLARRAGLSLAQLHTERQTQLRQCSDVLMHNFELYNYVYDSLRSCV